MEILTSRQWKNRRYLISPAIDFLLAGGVAFLLLPLLLLAFPTDANGQVDGYDLFYTAVAFALFAYLVNHPHFMVSYQLMYSGYRQKLQIYKGKHPHIYWRYIIAGLIVPLLLLAYLVAAFIAQDSTLFTVGVHVLFFTVGWHYTKQAFGVFLMLSALKNIFYTGAIRRLLLTNAMLVWMLTWLGGNIYVPGIQKAEGNYHGVTYTMFDLPLPPYLLTILESLVWFYGGLLLVVILWQSWRSGTRPSLTALAGYSSMYSLLLLAYYHPLWAYMTPLFHSAQYLLFVWAYKRGEAHSLMDTEMRSQLEATKHVKQFVLISFLLGILMFTGIPRSLEWLTGDVARNIGIMLPFIYAFDIFINIHHYFIDNVIWRKENSHVGKYIFYSREKTAAIKS